MQKRLDCNFEKCAFSFVSTVIFKGSSFIEQFMDERRWPTIIVDDKGNKWSLKNPGTYVGDEVRLENSLDPVSGKMATGKVVRMLNSDQAEVVNMYGDSKIMNIDDNVVLTKQYVKQEGPYRTGGRDPRMSGIDSTDPFKRDAGVLDFDFDTARLLERKRSGFILRDNLGNIINFLDGVNAREEIELAKQMVSSRAGNEDRTYEIIEGEIVEDAEGYWADILVNDRSIIGRKYNSEMGYVSKSGDYAFSPSQLRFLGVKGGGRYNPRYGTPEYWVNRTIDRNVNKEIRRIRKLQNKRGFANWINTQPEGPQIAAMHGGRPYSRTWVKDGRNKVLKKPIQVPGTDLKITALGMDRNGNSTVRLAPNDKRKGIAFSIQTNQNLPTLHRNKSDVLEGPGFITMKMADEIRNYVLRYGTEKQLSKGGLRRTALGGFRVMDRR